MLVPAAIGALVLAFSGSPTAPVSLDADLCPTEAGEISGSTMLLYDLRKPLNTEQASLPSNLLRDVSLSMERNTELKVFSLAGAPDSPRALLKRLCKPFANADLRVGTAQDKREALLNCEDLPSQLPGGFRESAMDFCGQLRSLGTALDETARRGLLQRGRVQDAYLVEALEDMQLDLLDRPQPHAIYVVSDMMQHAEWYSHLEDVQSDWSYETFARLRAAQIWGNLNHLGTGTKRVEVFYVPRSGLTSQPEKQQVHQGFWREYFSGSEVAFHNQSPAPAYAFVPLMNVPREAEQADQERLALERVLRQVREESARLEELEQTRLERGRQQLLETELTVAEAGDERSVEGESRDVLRPEEVSVSSPLPQELGVGDGTSTGADEVPPLPEEPPGPEQKQSSSPQVPDGGDRASAGTDEVPPPPEVAVSPSTAEPAASTEQPLAQEAPAQVQTPPDQAPVPGQAPTTCALQPWQDTDNISPDYPRGGRVNMGSATITVQFEVDADGATVDDAVVVVVDQSRAERERYFEVFAAEAVAAVKEWQLAFVEPVEEGCVRRQVHTVLLEFKYSGRFYPTRNIR